MPPGCSSGACTCICNCPSHEPCHHTRFCLRFSTLHCKKPTHADTNLGASSGHLLPISECLSQPRTAAARSIQLARVHCRHLAALEKYVDQQTRSEKNGRNFLEPKSPGATVKLQNPESEFGNRAQVPSFLSQSAHRQETPETKTPSGLTVRREST